MKVILRFILLRLLCLLIVGVSSNTTLSQIIVTNNNTASVLAQKLIGTGVYITNPTLQCNSNQSGIFNAVSSNLSIDSGIVLTTGVAATFGLMSGVNNPQTSFANANQGGSGDADLTLLSGTNTYDKCVLEFDFKADGDTVNFQYILGSEEYPTFNCSNYNDVFGFFISGPGYATPVNVALIPGTTIPVAINSVNDGTISQGGSIANCTAMGIGSPFTSYYISNLGGTSLSYDGFTHLFTAKAAVQQCQTYHLKLAIADGFDHIFDSGVFLKAGSLVSNNVSLKVLSDSINAGMPFLFESCDSAIVKIKRHLIQSVANTDTVQLLITGSASNGIDYSSISSTQIFSNNLSDSVKTFTIKPFNDFVTEGIETLKIVLVDRCGTHVDSTTIQIKDPPTFNILTADTTICNGQSVNVLGTFDPNLNFQWQPITNVNSVNILSAIMTPSITTTYTLSATHPGCLPVIDSIKITVNPTPNLSLSATNVICNGLNNGTITATTATSPISISIAPGTALFNSSPAVFTNLGIGTYLLTATNALGCSKTLTSSITQPQQLSWTTTQVINIACNTSNIGQIITSVSGGTGSKTYTLMPNNVSSNTGSFNGLAPGIYTVSVVDANNCSLSTILSIYQIANLNWVSVTPTHVTCNGLANGAIQSTAVGGSGTINYQLLPNNITNSMGSYTNLNVGIYTINASDATGCTASTTIGITQPAVFTSSGTSNNLSCNSIPTGSIQMSTSGGTMPVNYVLTPGNISNSTGLFSNLNPGNYTVVSTDSKGCTFSNTFNISQSTALVFSNIVKVQPTCTQPNNGSITVTVTGGQPTLTYALNTGSFQTSSTFNNLGVGSYTITVKDANNCTKTYVTLLNITNNPVLVNQTLPLVCGMTTLQINVLATNGLPNYNYTLQPGNVTNTTGSFGQVSAGTYTVNVIDANGCTASSIISVLPPLLLSWQSFIVTPITCGSTAGGSLQASVTSGTQPYSFNLQPVNISNNTGIFQNLNAGNYTITATDAINCTVTSVFTISQIPNLNFNIPNIVQPTCQAVNNGSITLPTTGGFGTKNFVLQPGNVSNTSGIFNGLSAGVYTISVADGYNCSNSTIVSVTQPSAININIANILPASCIGGTNGSMTISASGGTGAFVYKLNTGSYQTSGLFNNLGLMAYTITVKDANNCTNSSVTVISNPNAMSFTNITVNQANCSGSATGSLQANIQNATGTITYTLLPNNSANNTGIFANLNVNTYTIMASDGSGCFVASTASIVTPSILTWGTNIIDNVTCNGLNNGSVNFLANGGNGIVNYTLLPNGISNVTGAFTNLSVNNYTVIASDANGCTLTSAFAIQNPFPLQWLNSSYSNVVCNGTASGSIQANAIGGSGSLLYTLNPGNIQNATGVYSNLNPNTYTVQVSDNNGCTLTSIFTILQAAVFTMNSVNIVTPSCVPGNNGILTINVSGGSIPIQYQLNGTSTQTSNQFGGIGISNYTVSATDAYGCSITSLVNVSNGQTPVINTVTTQNILCHANPTGAIQTNASGGLGNLSYALQPTTLNNNNGNFTNLFANNYTIVVSDANGCTATSNVILTQPPLLIWDSVNNRDIACNGGSNGLVASSASGGNGLIQYTLLPNNITNANGAFLGLSVGNYTLLATDMNGCIISSVFLINQAPPIIWTNFSSVSPTCFSNSNGSIQANTSGGIGVFSYKLQPGNVTNSSGTFTNLAVGSYTVTAKDANSCTATTIIQVIPPPPIILANTNTTFASCNPGCDGSVTLTALGGGGAFSYSLNNGTSYQTSNQFVNLCSATYTVIVKDVYNCTSTSAFAISTSNGPNQITVQSTMPTCNGLSNGSLSATALGGTGLLTYTLLPNNTNNGNGGFANLSSATYTIQASDANGCTIGTSILLNQPPALLLGTAQVNSAVCNNTATGSVSILAAGGTGLVNYNLQPNASQNITGMFNSLSANVYTVTASDINACSTQQVINLSQPSDIILQIDSLAQVACFNGSTGSVLISATGGVGSFSYNLLPNNISNTNGNFTNLNAGNYTVVATDANLCTKTIAFIVTQPSLFNISQVSSTPPSCIPGFDGTMTISASGGIPAYTYAYNGNTFQNSNIIPNLSVGTFTVQAKDANGCTATSVHQIINSSLPVITNITSTQATCNPGCDAFIMTSSSGGILPHQFSLNTTSFQSNPIFNSLCANNYTITVKDGVGCTNTQSFSISTVSGPTLVSIALQNISCQGLSNGSIQMNTVGGLAPLQYQITPNNISNNSGIFTSLVAGSYTVVASDANGCTLSSNVLLTQPTSIQFNTPIANPVSCFGLSNGSIITQASGGAQPLSYSILPAGNYLPPNNFINLIGNTTYTIVATDANSCTQSTTAIVGSPLPILIDTLVSSAVTCEGLGNGSIVVSASGGNGLITYTLQPLSLQNQNGSFINLNGNTYTVTATDANNCSISSSTNIFEPAAIVINNLAITQISCYGQSDGTIQITAMGGTSPLLYNLQPNNITDTTGFFTALAMSNYSITITDANNCTISSIASIVEPAQLQVANVFITHVKCFGANNGSILLNAIGGTGAKTYTIQPNNISNTNGNFTALSAGTYTVQIQDINNCYIDTILNISQPQTLTLIFDSLQHATCFGANNGFIATHAIGGTLPYIYTLQPGPTSLLGVFGNVNAGIYNVLVTDSNGCTDLLQNLVINQPNEIVFTNVTHQDLNCYSFTSGSIQASAAGGNGLITYSIQPNLNVQQLQIGVFTNLSGQTYTVTATDANNCIATTVVVIQNYLTLNPTFIFTQPICFGESNGALQVNAVGGTAPLSYAINGSALSFQTNFTGLIAGAYTITIQDANGCKMDTVVNLSQPRAVTADIYVEDTKCSTLDDGLIIAIAEGGHGSFTYYLSPGFYVNQQGKFEGLKVNTYTLTIKDVKGCEFQTEIDILPPADPLRIGITKKDLGCYGVGTEAWAKANPTGGKSPYLYAWSNLSTEPLIENLSAGNYSVTVTDSNNCKVEDDIEIEAGPCCEQVFLPTAFSPNNDGKNDVWRMTTSTGMRILQFEIYDRWGKRVWFTFDQRASWDGKLEETLMSVDTYFYILRYICLSTGRDYMKKGDFTLIR